MPFTARDVLWGAAMTLQDENNRRWPLPELLIYLNDGLKEIATIKPTAVSQPKLIPLDPGTHQSLADGEHMIRVIRNIQPPVNDDPRLPGKVVTPIDRTILDAQIPDWHDPAYVPFSRIVQHVIVDPMNPRDFYVYPGNDGTGALEAIVSTVPDTVPEPANPASLSSYTATIDLPILYENPLREYVLFRAYSKDATMPDAAARAAAYKQTFMSALGVKQDVENVANVNTT